MKAHGPNITDEQAQLAINALVAALGATKSERRRTGEGKIEYVEVPDHPIRVVAANKVMEFKFGKPTTTAITASLTPQIEAGQNMSAWYAEVMKDKMALKAMGETALKIIEAASKTESVEIVVSPEKPENPAPPESSSEGFPR